MSAMRMKRDLGRILRALDKKSVEQKYKRDSNGMFVVPASEVLSRYHGGYGGIIVRILRQRMIQSVAENFLKRLKGENYVPSWEIEPADRLQWYKELKESKLRRKLSDEERADNERMKKTRIERLLKKQRKAERDSGRPVEFLLPFSPIVFREHLEFDKKNPQYDARITAKELIPVYSDGSVGDPKLYPISGPF